MGWAARLNPIAKEPARTKRLRTLCRALPRLAVLEALPKMLGPDRAIVLKMLDEVQPETQH